MAHNDPGRVGVPFSWPAIEYKGQRPGGSGVNHTLGQSTVYSDLGQIGQVFGGLSDVPVSAPNSSVAVIRSIWRGVEMISNDEGRTAPMIWVVPAPW